MIELAQEMGPAALTQLREILRTGQSRQASAVVGLLSRLDVGTLLELLPVRMPEWNRFYHDIVVRQIAYGAASDRGRTLLEMAEVLDAVVLARSHRRNRHERGSHRRASAVCHGEARRSRRAPPFVQLKAIESLGRLRDPESVPLLRELVESKKIWAGFITASCASPRPRP